MLRCLLSNNPKKWYQQVLPHVEFAINSIVNRTNGLTHFFVVYTKQPNFIVDLFHLPNMKKKAANA